MLMEYDEVWDAVQNAIVEVDEAEYTEPEFEPTLNCDTGGNWTCLKIIMMGCCRKFFRWFVDC